MNETKTAKIADLSNCDHLRNRPRTCTVECDNSTTCTGECGKPPLYVAELTIDPVTGQADFSNSVPILPQEEVTPELRENMQQLLDLIFTFFQDEHLKVESGELSEADQLLSPYVQENNPSTQSNPRSIPKNFKRRRA